MTILITRPAPDGPALAAQLNAAGISAIAQPLLEIAPNSHLHTLPQRLNQLKNGDFLIAVSAHAVEMADNYLTKQGIDWPSHVNYAAVGSKTGNKLAQCSKQPVSTPSERQDSEGLLALPVFEQVDNKRVLILRGNGGRELIYRHLTQQGANVSYCETYQRRWLELDGGTLHQQWLAQQVTQIVVTSGEQLDHLVALLPQQAEQWYRHCHLLVPSERIASQARALGFNTISAMGSVANPALFTTLSNISTKGYSDD